jgi:hypothetical protein
MASVATELPPIPIQGNPKRDGVGGGGGGGGVGVEVVSLPPVVPGKVSDQELPKLRDGAPGDFDVQADHRSHQHQTFFVIKSVNSPDSWPAPSWLIGQMGVARQGVGWTGHWSGP